MVSARDRALDFLAARNRQSLDLVLVEKAQHPTRDFDLEGWDVFVVGHKSPGVVEFGVSTMDHHRLGGGEYVAVNRINGEVRYLGLIGE